MTATCPPDVYLERLLADQLTDAVEQALEAHVAGCAACQRRLDQLTRCHLTLPARYAEPERGREDTPMPGGALERVADLFPAQIRLLAQGDESVRASEAAGHGTPLSFAFDGSGPAGQRTGAAPDPPGSPRRPATEPPRTTALAADSALWAMAMGTARDLLFGALALQAGLIDPLQFTESCKHWGVRPEQSLRDVLVDRGWILPADEPHLDYLLRRTLAKHQDDAKAALTALPLVVRQSLGALDALGFKRTVAGAASLSGSEPPGTPTRDPNLEMRYAFLSLHGAGGICIMN